MERDADNQRDSIVNALKDLMIIQLALAGANGHAIRQIAGVSMARVTRILKVIKKRSKEAAA